MTAISSRLQGRKAFVDGETFAPTLIALVVDAFGLEALSWDPEAIKLNVEEHYACEINPITFDTLMAGVAVMTTDVMWIGLPEFARMAESLSGEGADWDEPPTPDLLECAWAVTQSQLLHPDGTITAHPDIPAYIEFLLDAEGIIESPASLKPLMGDREIKGSFAWMDDPAMMAATYDDAKSRASQIDKAVQLLLQDLAEEIRAYLPHKVAE